MYKKGDIILIPFPFTDLSGTKVREMLRRGEMPPPEFSRPEVAAELMQAMRSPVEA